MTLGIISEIIRNLIVTCLTKAGHERIYNVEVRDVLLANGDE